MDLPDLVATLAGREVWLADSADPLGHAIPASEVHKQYTSAREAFKRAGAEGAISKELAERGGFEPPLEVLAPKTV